MKRTLLVLAVFCMLFSNAFAQENGNRDANGKVVRGPYETNKFKDNWFIEFGGGASMYLGGYNAGGTGRIRPVIDAGFGKWFTPSIGARVNFNFTPDYREKVSGSWYKFNYWHLHGDLMWNLSNAIGGYKETRVYQVIPYVGAGYAQASGGDVYKVKHNFALDAGIINKFRVSNRIDLNLELRATGMSHEADQLAGGFCSCDVPVSAVAGITIKFGKTNFTRVKATAPVSDNSLQKEYDKFKADLAAANAANAKLTAENDSLRGALAAVPAPVVKTESTSSTFITLYFAIGRATLNQNDLANLETYMKSVSSIVNGNPNMKFEIIGAADKATGTSEINERLSKQRAEYVKNILVNKYSINANRIETKYVGDTDNRFAIPELNRTATVFITVK